MHCLELPIPPLPQLMAVNKVAFKKDWLHYERSFPLYDLIIVHRGVFYITEDDTPYELREHQMIVLEPGKRHYGHKPCPVDSELYYLHFRHGAPLRTVKAEQIQWNSLFPVMTYHDLEPQEHSMYLPKLAELTVSQYEPIMNEMIRLRNHSVLEHMLPLQALLGQLLVMLQKTARSRSFSRSEQVCHSIIDYLYARMDRPFRLDEMAADLNFSVDYLSKCLKKHTGLAPLHYLNHIRIERAVSLLSDPNLTLQQIGEKVGITDYNYFLRLFRKMVGTPPAQYRASLYAYRRNDVSER
ncbi:helix-turn-helix transcriptional regulator [Paenibacillus ginsengarvi]|uniref:AraC family transcriptional regulator n=1 Tax=Paenibacillus ginsengarvi TaxID=400777 RepID=A0A3B0CHM5_9BACL|nr:AraC family transcriptional regulator [Paenibacillus ginsengarvi]RKN85225.1 AraC family transcriptional regulator [Paenibacillus ginsengarvi]